MADGAPYLFPCTLRRANDYVERFHRHNTRTSRDGGKWAVGAAVGADVVAVAIVGNPVSASLMDGWTAEVLRVCTDIAAAPRGTCSMLYAACWRAWRAIGGRRLVTYTLTTESGSSLKGLKELGWRQVAETVPCPPGWRKKDHLKRVHQEVMSKVKYRWEVVSSDYDGGPMPAFPVLSERDDGAFIPPTV